MNMENAACITADPNLFFPEPGNNYKETIKAAKEICASCPIAVQCLQHALTNEYEGIWGATTTRERKNLRKSLIIS
jgi:WhiB family redox-sensing transcriptional regulator